MHRRRPRHPGPRNFCRHHRLHHHGHTVAFRLASTNEGQAETCRDWHILARRTVSICTLESESYWLKNSSSTRTIAASLARCVVIFSTVRDINRSVIDYTCTPRSLQPTRPILTRAPDSNGENSFWAVAECALAIISSCLPTMGHVLRVWTLKLDVRTWTRSFTCGCTAGSHGADEGKDSTSSCAHLRDPGSKDLPRHASKTSTTNTHEEDEKPCVSGFPEEGIVVSTTVEQSDDLV